MGHVHLSRREILQSLPLLGSGAMLAPLWGERPDTKTPGVIRGALRSGAAANVEDIGKALRAGTNCGSCLPELKRIVQRSAHERVAAV